MSDVTTPAEDLLPYDVVILGAGYAGLMAALRIQINGRASRQRKLPLRARVSLVLALPYLKYFSIGNLARTSAGTSSLAANDRRIGRVASMIILAVMMSSVCEGSRVLPLEFLIMSTSSLAWVRVATAYMTSCSL
jgi:hypothetical protein